MAAGCGGLLPKIPVASDSRRVVSLDGRGGVICGTFDTGEAFCGGRELSLPYDLLNARHTGRPLQVTSSGQTTCILFESGDVGCGGLGADLRFVERPRGLAFQSIVIGNGFACGVDSERYVDCWGAIIQHRGESLLESIVDNEDTARPPERGTKTPFRVHGLAGVRAIRGAYGRLCALAGDGVVCTQLTEGYRYDDGSGWSNRCNPRQDSFDDAFAPPPLPGAPGDFGCDDDPFHLGEMDPSVMTLEEPREIEVGRARAVASFGDFACAATADDTVKCFGSAFEPLAPRSLVEHPEERANRSGEPELVPELAGATDLEFGSGHGCALSSGAGPRADPRSVVAETNKSAERGGQLWCWGNNESGQLGNAVNAHSSLPVRVQGLEDVEAFAIAGSSTCALADGELWCWGHVGGLPVLDDPRQDPCLDPKGVCVPHRVLEFRLP